MLLIKKLNCSVGSVPEIFNELDNLNNYEQINNVNWANFPYKPEAQFKIGYNSNALCILYSVNENGIRAIETKPNGRVWEDSCCEFFCSFDNSGYYNIETNCIGTVLLGYNHGKNKAEHAPEKLVKSIKTYSTLGSEPFNSKTGNFSYKLLTIIATKAFFKHNISLKNNFTFNANFYKCGDKTPDMHFLSWNPINTPEPNFHCPEFFGRVKLE